MAGNEWMEQAREHLESLSPSLQGEVLKQQAALALMQAVREGVEVEQLEQLLQKCVVKELQAAITVLRT